MKDKNLTINKRLRARKRAESRLKAYGERYNMTRDDFIRTVIHNNNITLAFPPGSKYK